MTKREVLGRIHNSPATDVAEPGILVKTRIAQQQVSVVANVDRKDISKSVARRNTNVKEEKEKLSATWTSREAPQIW